MPKYDVVPNTIVILNSTKKVCKAIFLIMICIFAALQLPFFSSKTSIEAIHGLMSQVIKNKLFNQVGGKEST